DRPKRHRKCHVALWILHFRGGKADVVPGVRREQRSNLRDAEGHKQSKCAARCADRWQEALQEIRAWFQGLRIVKRPQMAEILANRSGISAHENPKKN